MTKMTGMHGLQHFPYQYDNDNRYALAAVDRDIEQCHVDVKRTHLATDDYDQYAATVYDVANKQIGTASGQLRDNDQLIVPGADGLKEVTITRREQMGGKGTKGTPFTINYGPDPGTADYREWWSNSATLGTSLDMQKDTKDFPNVLQPGGYCNIPDVFGDEDYDEQSVTCYYPCIRA
ncbi:hypothetical protein K402DRAFT_452715 [Aulographum hederae CBS 113979]|uniref:Uncharacterized protein n=1 Tax=Aulographum hederae CBS 113979 TaxID=1176131 RepID=A0A6G1H5H4_9PEZI|nr:hypothetical protein K402DRAFT_452715 [Aulographum hederae CBS 113979]